MDTRFKNVLLFVGLGLLAKPILAIENIVIQVRLFQGTWMEGQPRLKQPDVLNLDSHPEINSLKAIIEGTGNDLRIASENIILKYYDLQNVQEMFSYSMFWNGKDTALNGSIIQMPAAFRFVIKPAFVIDEYLSLKTTVYFKDSKILSEDESSIEKNRLGELRGAIRRSNFEEQMEKILELEISLRIGDPVIVGFPSKDRSFFMMILPTKRPQPERQVMFAFPDKLRNQNTTGKAAFRISINEEGKVQDVKVIKSFQPYLDYAAVQAIKQWEFEPVFKEERSIPVAFNWTIEFDPERWGLMEKKTATLTEPPSPELQRVLDRCADYCQKLTSAELDYVCEETIADTNYVLNTNIPKEAKSSGQKESITKTDNGEYIAIVSSAPRILSPNRFKTATNRYICDYQMTKNGNNYDVRRTILKENGRKAADKKAILDEKRFRALRPLFSAAAFISRNQQPLFSYRLLKEEVVQRKSTYVIEAVPRNEAPGGVQGAKIWADKETFQILQSEIIGVPVEGYDFILNEAAQIGKDPLFTVKSTYQVERNGVMFPSRLTVLVEYPINLWGRSKQTRLETTFSYDKYKFFTVETEHQIIK